MVNVIKRFIDIDGKCLEDGHIVVVRYVWNSYVGEVQIDKYSAWLTATGHVDHMHARQELNSTATYQVISHTDPNHIHFNQAVWDWYFNGGPTCPVQVRVYATTS